MESTKQSEPESARNGLWLALITPAGRFLMRTQLMKGIVQAAHREGQPIEVEEAYELTSQLQVGQAQTHPNEPPQMQVAKMNVAYRIDGMLQNSKMYFSLLGAHLYYLDDLSQSDAAAYKDLIRGASNMGDSWMTQRTRQSSGLIIPPASVPPMGRRG